MTSWPSMGLSQRERVGSARNGKSVGNLKVAFKNLKWKAAAADERRLSVMLALKRGSVWLSGLSSHRGEQDLRSGRCTEVGDFSRTVGRGK